MKTLLAVSLLALLALPAHADSKVVNITDHFQWQTQYGTVYETLTLQGPATDGPVGFGEYEDEGVFISGAGFVSAVWATPYIVDPVPTWNGYEYLFTGGQLKEAPELSSLYLLATGLLSLAALKRKIAYLP